MENKVNSVVHPYLFYFNLQLRVRKDHRLVEMEVFTSRFSAKLFDRFRNSPSENVWLLNFIERIIQKYQHPFCNEMSSEFEYHS